MKTLIAEDDSSSQLLMQELLERHGSAQITVCGSDAVEAVRLALEKNEPYDLICLDIMMPGMDGHAARNHIRALECEKGITSEKRAKIIMVTALDDVKNITDAIDGASDAYLVKPISSVKLIGILYGLGFRGPGLEI